MSGVDGDRSIRAASVGLMILLIALAPIVSGVGAIGLIDTASAQESSFEGHVELSGNATSGTTWTYDVQNLSAVSGSSLSLTGDRITEQSSKSAHLTTGQSYTVDPAGNAAPENETVTIEGVEETSDRSISGVTNGDSISVGGNVPAENAKIKLSGSEKTRSESSTGSVPSGGSDSISIGGDLDPQDGSVSITAHRESARIQGDGSYWYSGDVHNYALNVSGIDTVKAVKLYPDAGGGDVSASVWVGETCGGSGGVEFGPGSVSPGSETTLTGGSVDVSGQSTIDSCAVVHADSDSDSPAFESGSYLATASGKSTATVTDDSGSETVSGGSTSLDLSAGSSVDISASGGQIDYDMSWTERDGVADPSVSIDGSTVSHSGPLDGTVEESISLSPGSQTVSRSYTGDGTMLDTTIVFTEVAHTEDPAVDVGGTTIYHSGLLGPGETVSEPVDLSEGSSEMVERTGGDQEAIVRASWGEVAETQNATVSINGNEVSESGTIAEGETVSLDSSISDSWIQEGSNEVSVSLDGSNGGPEPQTELLFSHDAETVAEIDRQSNTWEEETDIHRQFASDQSGVESRIEMPDNVVEIDQVTLEGSTLDSSQYSLNGTDLTVSVGSVSQGEQINISARGSKVRVAGGEISVTDPTNEGDSLNSSISIESVGPDDDLRVDVSETVAADRIHGASSTSWGSDVPVRVASDGSQELLLSQSGASAGSSATITESSWSASVGAGDIQITPKPGETPLRDVEEDGENPRLLIEPGETEGDSAEVTYYDAKSGEKYQIVDVNDDRTVDRATSNSPVTFSVTDQSATYELQLAPLSGEALSVGGASGSGNEGLLPPWLLLLLSLAGSIGFLGLSSERGFISRSTVTIGAAGISIVALEIVSPVSIIAEVRWALVGITTTAVGVVASSGLGVTLGAIGILIALWYIDGRTDRSIPIPLWIGAGALSVFWLIESLSPGAITEGRLPGIAEIGPLIWIMIFGGGALLIYRWIGSRQTVVQVGGEEVE